MSVQESAIAVAYSGGLDSAALMAMLADEGREVWPMYVRCGLLWEAAELEWATRYLDALTAPTVRAMQIFDLPLQDVYAGHWSLTGNNVPPAGSEDEEVYLPGRNPLLLIKPAIACAQMGIRELALASLSANPFADAQPEFLARFAELINHACGSELRITQPFVYLSKAEVLHKAQDAPLELALSCIQPVSGLHCGVCNKCHERQAAFLAAKIADPTQYAVT
ncbi:MAG: 7-cyano-7-deazaguanine synthase [Pirellulales bacterium]|nr:7-cyano-7-deazaguanine synthase [Pirellulales bacterium]